MIASFIARLLGGDTPPAPAAEAPSTARQRYKEMVERTMTEIRRCDSIERLIYHLDDHNGYVREAAVERAAELGSPALLPALAARLNDWVAPVRDKARAAVLALLGTLDPDRDAGAAMQLFQDVERLRLARRTDHAAWIASFEQRLVEVLGADRIVAAIDARHGRIAQLSFALARTYGLADTLTLCERALANKGNFAIARQAMDLARRLGEAEQQQLYRKALASPAGIVRAEALRALLRSDATPAALAASMLADANTWVRLVAIGCLAKTGIDVPDKYAERIAAAGADGRVLSACLAGLGDAGGAAHLGLIRDYTTYPNARVQIAAFLAWIHLVPKDKDDIARRVLRSPHRRVRKLFPVLARKLGAYVPIETALSHMREHRDYDQMLAFAQGAPWTMLEVIATIAGETGGDDDLRHRLGHELVNWSYSPMIGYTQPTAQQRAFLRQETVRQTLLGLLDRVPDGQRRLVQELQSL